jgi:hypothetical protein
MDVDTGAAPGEVLNLPRRRRAGGADIGFEPCQGRMARDSLNEGQPDPCPHGADGKPGPERMCGETGRDNAGLGGSQPQDASNFLRR